MAKPYKRVLIGADFHCGHRVGLTPTSYQSQIKGRKYYNIQRECWEWYSAKVKELKPDIYIINGDLIDGTGARSGGTELIDSDIKVQQKMAAECILEAKADTVMILRGTPYHTSPNGQDAEDTIGDMVKAKKVEDHGWYNVNGTIFDVRHHVNSTSVPYSKGTQISKDQIWNMIWNDYNDQPKARIFIRSHTHYFFHCGDTLWLGIITPALQAMGSKYGARKCTGHVDFGLVHFDIFEDGSYTWMPHIIQVAAQRASAVKL